MQVSNERVTIPTSDGPMPAYVARPSEGGKHPVVIVFQEIFGVNRHIRSVTDRVAAEGYVAVAPEVFWRKAPGVELGYDEQGLQKGLELMGTVTATHAIGDTRAALEWAQKRSDVGGRGAGAMGFCFGGHLTYLMACELPIAAAASFYGGGIAVGSPGNEPPPTVERTAKIKGRINCYFGEKDTYIPPDQVERIKKALTDAKVRHEVIVYPGVGHGFFCDERPDYDAKSAEDAWRRTKAVFQEELR
jgi:carboxymethylenebutenolidase